MKAIVGGQAGRANRMARRAAPRAALAAGVMAGRIAAGAGALEAEDTVHTIGASLFGENEVGGKGAGKEASGNFEGEIDMEAGTLCYFLETEALEGFTAAHIHKGKAGENGPPVVVLQLTGEDGDEVCAEVDAAVLKGIVKDQEGHYVNVHTSAFPAGAVRGQLGS